jgi:hypothetical protein
MKKIVLSFVLAVALALATSGMAMADVIAYWDYNNQTANNSTSAPSGEATPVANFGTGTQSLIGLDRTAQNIGYNDGTQPAGGSGDWSEDSAVGAADKRIRWTLPTTSLNTGFGWNVDTTGYTNIQVSIGVYIGAAAGITNGTDFTFEYFNGSTWSGTTFDYPTKGAWTKMTLDLSSLGAVNSIDFRFLTPEINTSTQVMTLDLVKVEGTPVPIPAAAWLLGSGLLGLVAIRRRMKK